MKKYCTEIILAIILLALSLISIFVGVIDIDIKDLLTNDNNALMIFVVSRLPRLLAIICTGMGMSVAGLIMQQLCMNNCDILFLGRNNSFRLLLGTTGIKD